MKIVCMEIDKYEGEPPVYYIVSHNATARELQLLSLRGRANPELHYYATRLDEKHTDEELLNLFKQKYFRKEPYFIRL